MPRTVWYPGHMARGRRELAEIVGALDFAIEVRDARAPSLTRSPALDELPRGADVWVVLSKADLADDTVTAEWLEALRNDGRRAWAADLRSGAPASLKKAVSDQRPRASSRKAYREARFAVLGTPNVGKSMLLNAIVGRRAAAVGGVPGVTKGVSWFKGLGCLAADSPGILDPHSDARAHRMLSWLSSTKGQVIGSWEGHALECLAYLTRRGLAGGINATWGVELSDNPAELLERVGRRLGKIAKGGAVDAEAAGRALIDALSSGRLGPLSLERPGGPPPWQELS